MSRVLNTVVELIRLEDKLELLHMNFISLQICFVRQDESCHTHQVNLNNALCCCLGYTMYMFEVKSVILQCYL